MAKFPIEYFFATNFKEFDPKGMLEEAAMTGLAIGPVRGETKIYGVKLDFNNGVRVEVPKGNFRLRISDDDTGDVFYDSRVSEKIVVSYEKYFVRWKIELYKKRKPVLVHVFDPTKRRVHFVFTSMALGDTLVFLPYVREFQKIYDCPVSYYVPEHLRELCHEFYPDIEIREELCPDTYATFYFSAGIEHPGRLPIDRRIMPMEDFGRVILRLAHRPGRLMWRENERVIKEPYVCIAVQASMLEKCWLHDGGWDEVVAHLKGMGYRVICIDQHRVRENGGLRAAMPEGAEDMTGDRPLVERADMLSHADFFIGLPSGLAWLADAVRCPVVLIGGFSYFWYEFATPYRVYNRLACTGCFNDTRCDYQRGSCPRHGKDSEHYLECSYLITPFMVNEAIDRLIHDRKMG